MRTERLANDEAGIRRAAKLLRDGKLVAFPTETVYGLGARADEPDAVRAIFAAKGRPSANPLIVHVASTEQAAKLAASWPPVAEALAKAFWPGPLTLVVARRNGAVADEVAGSGPTVGVRVPDHPVALRLLEVADLPLAAPSANRSNTLSPTTAEHVLKSLGGRIDAVLDGGPTRRGIESTIVDVTCDPPALLRHGALPLDSLTPFAAVIDRGVDVVELDGAPEAPGRYRKHYAPKAKLFVLAHADAERRVRESQAKGERVGLLLRAEEPPILADAIEVLPSDPAGFGAGLYAALHRLDDAGCEVILASRVPSGSAWAAVRDRLNRASQ